MSPVNTPQSIPGQPTNEKAATAAVQSGRTADGCFAKNNQGGPGNPYNRRVAELRQAMLETIRPEDLQEVLAAVLFKAKTGDLAAAKLLLAYTIGKPGQSVDPDTVEQQEWQMHQQAAVPPADVDKLLTEVPAATANTMARIGWPCTAAQSMGPLIAGLRAAEAADAAQSSSPAGAAPARQPAREDRDATSPATVSKRILNSGLPSAIGESGGVSTASAESSPPQPAPNREAEWDHLRQILIAHRYCPPDDKRD
jgi:hypothetical protein